MTSTTSAAPAPPTPDEFRSVMGHFATGVTVVTTHHEGRDFATTASAVSSVSLEPALFLVCMNERSVTGAAIGAAGRLGVNILGHGQQDLARRFAGKEDKELDAATTTLGPFGQPLLHGAIATMEGRIVHAVAAGTHVIYIAEAMSAATAGGEPLAYFRGGFGRLLLDA